MSADLHLHSTFSDGRLTPPELVRLARERGLGFLALTDHDSVAGVPEAQVAGTEHDLEVWAGVELGCDWGGREVHILGLGLAEYDPLEQVLSQLRDGRGERGQSMVRRLSALGLPITWEEVLAESGGRAIGRPHVARILKRNGAVATQGEAFERYLGEGRPGYVDRFKLEPARAIDLIHLSGGLAILAHPALAGDLTKWVGLLDLGLDGLEVDHPAHSVADTRFFRQLAIQRGLLATAGTDFHGDGDGRHARYPGDIRLEEAGVRRLREALAARQARG